MKEKVYKVILEGTIQEAHERSEVVQKLAGLFKKDAVTIERLLSGKPRPISRGLDRQKALKYVRLIEQTGAVCRAEAEEDVSAVTAPAEPEPAGTPKKAPLSADACPRCGYHPSSDEDVMVVRGDCPKCGLIVRSSSTARATRTGGESDYWGDDVARRRDPWGDRVPASFRRRFLAGLQTLSLFCAVYLGIVYVMIFFIFPASWITGQTGIRFLKTAFLLFPVWTSLMSIGVVSLLVPLLNDGRSMGQSIFGIEPLFSEEAEAGGPGLSVAFRAAAIATISFVPGRIVLWICFQVGVVMTDLAALIVTVVCACLSWGACTFWARRKDERRSILDFAAGTVQVEAGLMPDKPILKALMPLGVFAVAIILQVLLFPLIQKAFA